MINYKKEDFTEVIQSGFGKNSIDVVIDFVGSPYWESNIQSMAMDGRVIYLAILGGATVEKMSLLPILRKRLTIKGSTLRNRSHTYKAKLTNAFKFENSNLLKEGKLTPVIDSIFDWQDAENAHQRMQANKNAGKIILTGM